jgi:Tfp pilus assembly protein PilX
MNEGSGGLGAVSAGISHSIVLIILVVVGLLVAFVGWKLLKLILAAIAG